MSDDEYRNGFGDEEAPVEKTAEENAAEEAKAEEEFIDTPEDHVDNPLVPDEQKEDDSEDEDRLKGAIGSGNLAVDYPEEKELESNEVNMAEAATEATGATEAIEATEATEPTVAAEAPVAEAPAETATVAVEETPAEPETAPAATTEAVANATTQASTGEPKKKSKAGLIITLVVVALLLIGGAVGFFIWMSINESPEKVLKDSLTKIWTSENVQMSGTLTAENGSNGYEVSFDSAKSDGNLSGSGKIKSNYDGMDVDIDFSASYIKGGNLYVKIEGLEEVVKNLSSNSSTASVMSSYADLLSDILGAVVEKIDGQWYKISAGDLKEMSAAEGVSCMLENLDGAMDKDSMKSVADVYEKHPFITINKDTEVKEEDGVKYISVTVSEDDSEKFIDELKNIDGFKKIAACSEESESDDDYDYFDGDDDEDDVDDEKDEKDGETKMTLGVKSWSHELVSVELEKSGDSAGKLSAKISYDKKDIAAPSDAKSISDLGNEIQESLKSAMTSYVNKLCSQMYASYGQNYVDLCVQSSMKQMVDFDISELFDGFIGGNNDSI